MTLIRFSPSSLREGRWYEYLIRFALGGAVTVLPASSAVVMDPPSAVFFSPFLPSSAPAPR